MTADDLIARLLATADAYDAQADAMTPALRPTRVTVDPVTVEVDRQAQLLDISFGDGKDRISPANLADRIMESYREAAAESAASAGSTLEPELRQDYMSELPGDIAAEAQAEEALDLEDERETAGPATPFTSARHDGEIRFPEGVDPNADPATVMAQMQASFQRVADHDRDVNAATAHLRATGEAPKGRPIVRLELDARAALTSLTLNQGVTGISSAALRDHIFEALERARQELDRQMHEATQKLGDTPPLWPGTDLGSDSFRI